MINSKIAGLGAYLPKKILTNEDLEKLVDTSNEWIFKRTGISERRIADDDETSSTMGVMAAREAISNAGVSASDIDLVIVATTTPDKVFPSTACLVQAQLDIPPCAAFDVTAVCSGFVYALDIADKFIKSGQAKHALVIGSECISRLIDWTDRTTCVLFGDGAGACVLSASADTGLIGSKLQADGRYGDYLYADNPRNAPSEDAFVHMKGRELFKFMMKELSVLVDDCLTQNNLTLSDIDWIVPHQANDRMLEALAKALHYPVEQVISTIKQQANTSAATIPVAMKTAVDDGRIKRGDTVMLIGFGGGLTWGTVVFQY